MDQNSRFAKLLLRLPALRSVGLKCINYLFINRDWTDQQMDNYLRNMLERRVNYNATSSLQSTNMNSTHSINSSINNSFIGVNSSMNSINDNHHIVNQTLLGLNLSNDMSSNNLMNVIDNNNNLTNGSSNNSSNFNDLNAINSNCINFMNSSTMNNLIINNAAVNSYLPDLSNSNNLIRNQQTANLSMNHTNSPLSLS